MNLQSIYSQTKVWNGVTAQELLAHEMSKVGQEAGRLECLEQQVSYLADVVGNLIPHCHLSDQQLVRVLGAHEWEPQ